MTVKNRSRICLTVSCCIFVLALVLSLFGLGINQGIDFAGGMAMQYSMGKEVAQSDVEDVFKGMNIDHDEVNIRIKDIATEDVQTIQQRFVEGISEKYPDVTQNGEVNYVGPVAGRTLLSNAFWSVVIAAALMLLYIAIRFDFSSGLAAVLGLLHDVLMMLAFMVLLRSIIQMNSTFIAAMLTIVGYSINNTIVIFDRIRENEKKTPGDDRVTIVNRSVKECLGRTLNTTITTLITIVALYIMGVASIKEFALPIIVGILSGVYSANMINGYVWAMLDEKLSVGKKSKKVKAKA